MKNKKFTSLILVAMLALSLLVTGCGKKITSQESAQVLWDMNVKHDTSNVSKIGMKDEDAKKAIDNDMSKAKESLKTTFTQSQLKYTDAQLDDVCNALLTAYGKMTVKIDEVSNDGKKAQVKFNTTYIDLNAIDEKAANDALQKVQSSGITNQSEFMDKASEEYINNLVNALNNVTPSSDTKEKTYAFVKEGNTWLPEDKTNFGTSLGQLITNQI